MITEITVLTVILEIMTIAGRILFGSAKELHKRYKFKIRIHHGYVGIVLILTYFLFMKSSLLFIGSSLFLSDLLHHFVVLPWWVGKTEFP